MPLISTLGVLAVAELLASMVIVGFAEGSGRGVGIGVAVGSGVGEGVGVAVAKGKGIPVAMGLIATLCAAPRGPAKNAQLNINRIIASELNSLLLVMVTPNQPFVFCGDVGLLGFNIYLILGYF